MTSPLQHAKLPERLFISFEPKSNVWASIARNKRLISLLSSLHVFPKAMLGTDASHLRAWADFQDVSGRAGVLHCCEYQCIISGTESLPNDCHCRETQEDGRSRCPMPEKDDSQDSSNHITVLCKSCHVWCGEVLCSANVGVIVDALLCLSLHFLGLKQSSGSLVNIRWCCGLLCSLGLAMPFPSGDIAFNPDWVTKQCWSWTLVEHRYECIEWVIK